ncbi:MAG TPA: aminoglycoside phosphotransferase family protein [Candidatus Cloacimonadota bacterium]|jgi:aminoglycoside phosphotransferase (APT) family kinase protein|nr:aminoglycoside phosphotransferase family protein [Candidatus Cloacimonadales bacterium]HPY96188.1 aminoglycoside phosphotransferase family protein [Candidatus Cloacimonadota bacterium]HQB40818.1 aminoglycoside phosphotransferase family protein [Candidatus Cloacimonadota bacterium]
MSSNLKQIDLTLIRRLFQEFDASINIKSFIAHKNSPDGSLLFTLYESNSQDKYSLNIFPQNDVLCRKEMILSHYLQEIISLPEVYYVNESCNIIDKPYQISEYLEGVSLKSFLQNKNELSNDIVSNIAESLALVHRTVYNEPGELNVQLEPLALNLPMNEWHLSFLHGLAGKRLGIDLAKRVEDFLHSKSADLEEIAESFVLSHGNFSAENILISGNKYQAIIGWEGALAMPSLFDIGRFFREPELFPRKTARLFAEAYNNVSLNPLNNNWQNHARLMDCLNLIAVLSLEAIDAEQEMNIMEKIKSYICSEGL